MLPKFDLNHLEERLRQAQIVTLEILIWLLQVHKFVILNPKRDQAKQSVVERILTPDEVKRLYESARSERDQAMIKTAYLLGLRVDELLNLHWQDFSRDSKGNHRVKVIRHLQ
jgi:integrase